MGREQGSSGGAASETPDPVSVPVVLGHDDDATAVAAVQQAVLDRLGPWAYGVIECETGGWLAAVIWGPATGAAGEIGLGQLHPRGKLPAFYAAGYTDPWDPYQQIDYLAFALPDDPGAWTCATATGAGGYE